MRKIISDQFGAASACLPGDVSKGVDGDKGHETKPLSRLPEPKTEIHDDLAGKYDEGPEPPFFSTLFLAIRVLQGDSSKDGEIRAMLYGELDAITRRLSDVLQDFKVALVDYFANEPSQCFVNEIVGLGKLYRHQNLVLHFIAHGKANDRGISRGDRVDGLQDEQLGELIKKVCASLQEKVLVFFNVCHSDTLAYLVSEELNDRGATIGYKGKLSEPLAKEFSARFYSGAFVERSKMSDSFEAARKSIADEKRKNHRLGSCGTASCNAKPVKEGCRQCNPDRYVKYGVNFIWDWRLPENTASYVGDNGGKHLGRNAFDAKIAGTGILSAEKNK